MLPDGAQEAFVNSNKICKVTTRDVGQAGERDVMMTVQKQSGTTSKEDAWKHQDCKKKQTNKTQRWEQMRFLHLSPFVLERVQTARNTTDEKTGEKDGITSVSASHTEISGLNNPNKDHGH